MCVITCESHEIIKLLWNGMASTAAHNGEWQSTVVFRVNLINQKCKHSHSHTHAFKLIETQMMQNELGCASNICMRNFARFVIRIIWFLWNRCLHISIQWYQMYEWRHAMSSNNKKMKTFVCVPMFLCLNITSILCCLWFVVQADRQLNGA